jgi:hypothetical protein
MQLMLWAMDIVHRTRNFNVDADYMSKLAEDTNFDPLLKQYLLTAADLRQKYPAPTGELKPENMPNYRPKRRATTESDAPNLDFLPGVKIDGVPIEPPDVQAQHVLALVASVEQNRSNFLDSFSVYPIRYYTPTLGPIRNFVTTRSQSRARKTEEPLDRPLPLQNGEVSSITRQLNRYQAILYGFGGGHVHQNLLNMTLPIQVVAAADMDSDARALMQELMEIPRIFATAQKLFDWIASNDDLYVDLYLCHAPFVVEQRFVHSWWKFQARIIIKARAVKGLQVFAILIPSVFQAEEVSDAFCSILTKDGWILHTNEVDYPSFGDSIDDRCSVILGVHQSAQANAQPITLITPPSSVPKPIADFILEQFNDTCYAVSFSKSSIEQYPSGTLRAVDPLPTPLPRSNHFSSRLYDLVPSNDIITHTTIGTGVYDTAHLLPPLAKANDSIFGQLFGIEFEKHETQLVRPISLYEVVKAFGYPDATAQKLALKSNVHLLLGAVPLLYLPRPSFTHCSIGSDLLGMNQFALMILRHLLRQQQPPKCF